MDISDTRSRILDLLRGESRTVNDLAEALGVTDNAVRAQLASLESEGLVERGAPRKGFRKPHQSYVLTEKAEAEFAEGYVPALNGILSALEEKMSEKERANFLREAGKQMAETVPSFKGNLQQRAQSALLLLRQLGGLPELTKEGSEYTIRSKGCPLSGIVYKHPDACFIAESLLEELLQTKVRHCCDHCDKPRCCFKFAA